MHTCSSESSAFQKPGSATGGSGPPPHAAPTGHPRPGGVSLSQLKVASPTGKDAQDFLKLDETSLFWKNRVGRVLLVTALGNVGSMVGAWLAGASILGMLIR